jgi:hypothetical protein
MHDAVPVDVATEASNSVIEQILYQKADSNQNGENQECIILWTKLIGKNDKGCA